MRVVNGLFCLVFVAFALVQYNDPDAPYWAAIYALAAIWCGLAAFMPAVLTTHGTLRAAFLLSLLGALIGAVQFWPSGTAWWNGDVIWSDEPVREGLGMAIVFVGLLSAGVTWWRASAAAEP